MQLHVYVNGGLGPRGWAGAQRVGWGPEGGLGPRGWAGAQRAGWGPEGGLRPRGRAGVQLLGLFKTTTSLDVQSVLL